MRLLTVVVHLHLHLAERVGKVQRHLSPSHLLVALLSGTEKPQGRGHSGGRLQTGMPRLLLRLPLLAVPTYLVFDALPPFRRKDKVEGRHHPPLRDIPLLTVFWLFPHPLVIMVLYLPLVSADVVPVLDTLNA